MKKLILITLLYSSSLCAGKLEWVGNCSDEMTNIFIQFGDYLFPDINWRSLDSQTLKTTIHQFMIKFGQDKSVMEDLEKLDDDILNNEKIGSRKFLCYTLESTTKQDILNMANSKEDLQKLAVSKFMGGIYCYCTIGGNK